MHCHIVRLLFLKPVVGRNPFADSLGAYFKAWHVGEGLGVQFLESKSAIPNLIPSDYASTCAAWKKYYDGTPAYSKDDSGL